MEARLRSVGRWKLALIPLAAILVAALGYGAWSAWRRLPDPESQRQRTEAMALLTLDDVASLGRALELLDGIQAGERASRGAAGERGLARALLVTALAEEVEPLSERQAAASLEKARLEREQPPGAEDGLRALTVEMARVEVELAPKRLRLEALHRRAAEELQAVASEARGARDAARGQAVLAVLDGNAEEVQRTSTLLRSAGPDHWADLADLWLAVRKDGASRDQAIPRLMALASAHPDLIRARYVVARALLAAGRREEAISAVTLLLSANPHHERAQRLRAQLATSAAPPLAAPVPVVAPPKQAWLPRPALPPAAASNVQLAQPGAVSPPPAATNQAGPMPTSPMPTSPAASSSAPGMVAPPAAAPAPQPEPLPPPAPAPAPAAPAPKPPPSGPFDPTQG